MSMCYLYFFAILCILNGSGNGTDTHHSWHGGGWNDAQPVTVVLSVCQPAEMMLHLDRGRVFVMERSERMSHVNECMCNSANRGGWNDASSKLCTVLLRWQLAAMGHLHYNSLSKSLKYDLWLLWAISFTIPYKNHGNITYDSYGWFPVQFLIKIIEIWPMAAMGNFHYNSLSKSMKYDLWLLWVISFTIPYQHHWNMTCESYGSFQL